MKTAKQIADKIIKILTDEECTPDEMLIILKVATDKYLRMKYKNTEFGRLEKSKGEKYEAICNDCGKKHIRYVDINANKTINPVCDECLPF